MTTQPIWSDTSACLAWPVQTLPQSEKSVRSRHVTGLYLPDVRNIPKEKILDALRNEHGFKSGKLYGANAYRLADVLGTAAFGPNFDIPVLLVGIGKPWPNAGGQDQHLTNNWEGLEYCLSRAEIPYDKTYREYRPHVTVRLSEVLNPPKQVLLRPLELWYMDDEPVEVL